MGGAFASYLQYITFLMEGEWLSAFKYVFINEHALTGHRYLTLLNVLLFGLNSRIENIIYFFLVFLILILILRFLIESKLIFKKKIIISTHFLPIALGSIVSAGSWGMETGTYIGFTILLTMLSLIENEKIQMKYYVIISLITIPITTFYFLGSYSYAFCLYCFAILGMWKKLSTSSRHKLLTFTLINTGFSALFLFQYLRKSPGSPVIESLNIIQYLSNGFTASILNANILEQYPSVMTHSWVVGICMLLWVTVNLILKIKYMYKPIFSLSLLGLPFFQSIVIMVGRPFEENWLMAPWYGFIFHLYLAGIFILWASPYRLTKMKSVNKVNQTITPLLLVLIAALVISGNYLQFKRQKYERAYYANIENTILKLNPVEVRQNGFTQLEMSLSDTIRTIDLLEKYKLNVYNK